MKSGLGILFSAVILTVLHTCALAQGVQKKVVINWSGIQTLQGTDYEPVKVLYAPELSNSSFKNYTPEYYEKFAIPENYGNFDIIVTHAEWEPVGDDQLSLLTYPLVPDQMLSPQIKTATERGIKMAMLTIVPIIGNKEGGISRLKSFTINVVYLPELSIHISKKSATYSAHSVLARGNWYKIQLDKTGIYKLTYSDMQAAGVDMSAVTPDNIRLFGNGGGLLPEANSVSRYDDLTENAIKVVSAIPDAFAAGDYILFYGTAPDKIYYNKVTHKFEHTKNIYSDFTYYFLNFDGGAGIRIENQEKAKETPNYICTSFTEGVFYEEDHLNFISSGKDWVGERMDANTPAFQLPEFTFPNLIAGKQSWIRFNVVAKAGASTTFEVTVNDIIVADPMCPAAGGQYVYATKRMETKSFFPETDKVKVSFQYKGEGTETGWLDWVELNVPREMIFTGGQMAFADPYSVWPGNISEFRLQGSSSNVAIWEVTNPVNVKHVVADQQADVSSFVLKTDSIRQFVAWDNTSFLSATFAGKVISQDLHGIESTDLLIVTHKDYFDQANRLANHHRTADGMKVAVVTNEQVYNEFSSGSPDIAAIRDFARMLYTRPETGSKLKYLLLFGDGSYDYKDRIPGNTNRVLTFQTKESLDTRNSYVSDDFYGLLDDDEGYGADGLIDIGIGRFPVSSQEQAQIAVDKCIFYATNSDKTMGDWRNKIALVSDDGNGNMHFGQAEYKLAPRIGNLDAVYNMNKAYMDAYKQISTPAGERCPDVNAAISTYVENGVLVMNYTGHGGETGWADEAILSVREIDAWTNYDHMPVFMTATCEFSRYDDPVRLSAGEHVFLNPVGGGIALFTTTRLASPFPNIELNEHFYDTLLASYNGEYPRFGDVIAYAKNMAKAGDAEMIRNFTLLGDPALRLAYPKNKVVTTEINGKDTGHEPDTISAMEPIQVKGILTDVSGNKLTTFTGVIDVKVFDKERILETLGSDPTDYPDTYTVQDNYIYQGRATVTNGDFVVNFIVPRDIDYSYGHGKISYYANDGTTDANGYSQQIVIGGSGGESPDITGPEISLFINDLSFKDGGITGETPLLIAKLSDESGINTMSSAIGHEIVATLDGDNSTSIVLNSYYTADLDSYRTGEVRYKYAKLTEGMHTLTLKAWDVFNNSSEATVTFKVTANMQITITDMLVYPNPFSEEVSVEFDINLFDSQIEAHLEIFDMNGSSVSTTDTEILLSQGYKAGVLAWDGRNVSGNAVPPGVYLLSIKAGNGKSETVKAARLIKYK